ncbi:MAG: QueT transporter family protein [Deltaproteobacteria bacterium]|nr:QueT transporter family protein [Deltaproteobacteria bacterium]
MRELFKMWRNTRMIVLTAICGAAYVAVLLPFKGLVIVPGLTEVRPGAALPIILGFLFGPAAVWGAAIGNTIADALGGMLSPGTIPGFFGNMIFAYIPYSIWRALFGRTNPVRAGLKGWIVLYLILVTDCLTIGAVIGYGVDLLKLAPFAALGLIITVNNLLIAAVSVPLLVGLLYERVRLMGLLYFQVMDEEPADQNPPAGSFQPTRRAWAGLSLCLIGSMLAFAIGLYISGESLGAGYGVAAFSAAAKGSVALGAGMIPGFLILLLGLILL